MAVGGDGRPCHGLQLLLLGAGIARIVSLGGRHISSTTILL